MAKVFESVVEFYPVKSSEYAPILPMKVVIKFKQIKSFLDPEKNAHEISILNTS